MTRSMQNTDAAVPAAEISTRFGLNMLGDIAAGQNWNMNVSDRAVGCEQDRVYFLLYET